MGKILFLILLVASLIAFLVALIGYIRFSRDLVFEFTRSNVIVGGKKGKGKDLVFQYVINHRKKQKYTSNMDYGGHRRKLKLENVSVAPNTFENMINGNVERVIKQFHEKEDIYISDAGIYLPSQYDHALNKRYPSLPIVYATSRHLFNGNIHCNAQNIERVWKLLREQADFFVIAEGCLKLPHFIIVKCTTYDRYQSAINHLLPLKSRFGNKYSKAEVDQYKATNGEIRQGYLILRKKAIKYDTRAFHKIFYGRQAPIPSKRIKRRKVKKHTPEPCKGVGAILDGATRDPKLKSPVRAEKEG